MKRLAAIFLVATVAACAVPTEPVETGSAAIEQHDTLDGELVYVRDAIGTNTVEASHEFHAIELHVDLAGGEVRARNAAGEVVLDWIDVSTLSDDSQPASFEGVIELPEAATLLDFRAHDSVGFARFVLGEEAHHHEGEVVIPEGAFTPLAAIPGRWIPPADVLAIANTQYLPYSGAPSSCSGTFRPGTRKIADFLRAEFEGATSYGGYACRANTANTSQLSVHASGRAIDLFVPLDGGEADNDMGDPIAHYLIENAEELGIEFIVWDRTSWGAHREAPKHRAYTGPHPHHDHLHIEIAPTVANNPDPVIPPPDQSPIGYLDAANCDEGIRGWAQDPDAPDQPIQVYISIGGPVFTEGAFGYWTTASNRREDLCEAIGSCDHGFAIPAPYGLMDGQPREVYVYGEDVTGGRNSELMNSGRVLQCDPPEAPMGPEYGVVRHVPNGEAMEAWGLDWNGIVTVDDATLDAYTELAPLSQAPDLQRTDAPVYLVEGNVKRHVTSGSSLNAWGFSRETIVDTDTSGMLEGVPLEFRPFLVRGSGPGVYLVTAPPPLWADGFEWSAPPRVGVGQTAQVSLTLRNRGSLEWTPEAFSVVDNDAVLGGVVPPGESIDIVLEITAPESTGPAEYCYELSHGGFPFHESSPCLTIEVVEEQIDEEDLRAPGGSNGTSTGVEGSNVLGEGSCSAAAGAPMWGLLLLGLLGLRRRRGRIG